VSKVLGLALGILAAIGGFVDIGDLVFNVSAGATFGYQLMWVIPIGVVGIIVYSEMCGRVAAVSGKAVFDAIRERLGFTPALGALVASEVVNLMTLAAEIGGVAIALQLLSGLPYRWLIILAIVGLAVIIWVTSFEWLERIFGYGGLCLLGFAVAAVKLAPDWGKVGNGLLPYLPQNNKLLYAYFAIGLLGAAMTPYEVYFYSSGGIEERWSPKDIGLNRANAIIGYGLGGFLSFALMITGAALFLPHGISPEHLGTIALGAENPLGRIGLLFALVGILFAVGGASIDTVFSGAYNLAQFCGWEWGRYRQRRAALHADVARPARAGARDCQHRRRPGDADRIRCHLLRRRAPAHLHPDPARRERQNVHGSVPEPAARERVRRPLSRGDYGRRAHRCPVDAADERGPGLSSSQIDIGLQVLDRQLLDKNGRRCGNVDDVAIEGGAGEAPEVVAILVGPGYWPQRAGLIGKLAGWIGGGRRVRVDWSDVRKIDSAVELKRKATELGLGRGDDRLRPYLDKIPGAGR
jgi:manganese transport protein